MQDFVVEDFEDIELKTLKLLDKNKKFELVHLSNINPSNSFKNFNFDEKFYPYDDYESLYKNGVHILVSVRAMYHKNTITQEILIHSESFLEDFIKVILCPLDDHNPSEQCSCNKIPENQGITIKGMFPGCFLFIDGVLYTDSDDQFCADFCKKIANFYSDNENYHTIQYQNLKIRSFKNVKMKDISVAVGVANLFCHNLICEHLIVFKDIRSINVSDLPKYNEGSLTEKINDLFAECFNENEDSNKINLNEYVYASLPRVLYSAVPKKKMCSVCLKKIATWATRDNLMAYDDPFYFCDQCFDSFVHDENNEHCVQCKSYRINIY